MKKTEKIPKSLLQTISLSLQLGFTIALPLVVLAIGGRILDKKFQTSPLFLILGLLSALIISTILLYQKIKAIIKESEKEQ